MNQVVDTAKAEALSGRLFNGTLEAIDVVSAYIGERLGLYQALAQGGPATAGELAARSGIHPRYAREWLEHQAVTGILEVDDESLPDNQRRYALDPGYAEALINPESPYSVTPLTRFLVSCVQAVPQLLEAYRTGGGVPWGAYGQDAIEAQGDFNRPWLNAQLGSEYLPAVPDIHARLQADPPAQVLDVACGLGWAAIAIARAYPKVTVLGIDADPASIPLAQQNAVQAGVADRVRFEVRDAADPSLRGNYDLAIVVEAVHDLSQPVEVLRAVRGALAPGGSLIVADERVEEQFTAPGSETERFFYGASILLCLPAAMAETPTAATGTVMRTPVFREYTRQAGFGDVEILGVDHPFLRFYRLRR